METALSHTGIAVAFLLLLSGPRPVHPAEFRIGTYNLENYRLEPGAYGPEKSPAAKAKVRESLLAMNAQVVALQEIGSTNALLDLLTNLRSGGLDYPHWAFISAFDTNVHLAVLSQFPIVARRPHTKEGFLLRGRRYRVARGFAELDIQVNPRYRFTLFAAHLKSKRPVPFADEADLREEEARLLRGLIETRLKANPKLNLVVLGDLNDYVSSPAVKLLLGTGKLRLTDTRPGERNGDSGKAPAPKLSPRTVTWTHFYGLDDVYSRLDYILISPGMASEWVPAGTFAIALPDWGLASDHRPIVATFSDAD